MHIDNRRLFNLAAGRLKADAWEREHLHQCNVCQGVLYVLIRQTLDVPENLPKSNDAA